MTASSKKPQRGTVRKGSDWTKIETVETPAAEGTPGGLWRPDIGFSRDVGLQVTMRRVPGLTSPKVLLTPFRFQVPPLNDFSRPYGVEFARYSTLRLGERARPQGRKLQEVAMDSLFLDGPGEDQGQSFVIWEGAPEPQRLLTELRIIMGEYGTSVPTPFRLTIAQPSVWAGRALVNSYFWLTDLVPTQKPGEIGTEYISLAFLQCAKDTVAKRRQPRSNEKTHTHTLRPGHDDLYELAKRYYHAPSKWRTIAKKNGIKGVSPGSEAQLSTWAKKHHRKTLTIPPEPGG